MKVPLSWIEINMNVPDRQERDTRFIGEGMAYP